MRLSELKIDPDFRDCLPRLTDEEYGRLEENILEYGIQSPLIIWRGYIVDGHNRYSIAFTNNIVEIPVREEYFESKEEALQWILENQLGRRNLSDFARNEIALRYKEVIARRAKERQLDSLKKGKDFPSGPNDPNGETGKTRAEIAKIAGTNDSSVKRTSFILKHGSEEEIDRARRGGKGNSQGAVINEIKKRMAPEGMKVCGKCEEIKPVSEFYVDQSSVDGLDCFCKDCRKESVKASQKKKAVDTATTTEEIVAEMYSDVTKPYTAEMLVNEVTANSENYISLLRNMIEDRAELLDTDTKHELRVTVDNIIAAIVRIQEELL